jgi:hypothetical protein
MTLQIYILSNYQTKCYNKLSSTKCFINMCGVSLNSSENENTKAYTIYKRIFLD